MRGMLTLLVDRRLLLLSEDSLSHWLTKSWGHWFEGPSASNEVCAGSPSISPPQTFLTKGGGASGNFCNFLNSTIHQVLSLWAIRTCTLLTPYWGLTGSRSSLRQQAFTSLSSEGVGEGKSRSFSFEDPSHLILLYINKLFTSSSRPHFVQSGWSDANLNLLDHRGKVTLVWAIRQWGG